MISFLLFRPPQLHPRLCLRALGVIIWPMFSFSILGSPLLDSKVLQAGARSIRVEEGETARERKRDILPIALLGHVVVRLWADKKRKRKKNRSCDNSIHFYGINSFENQASTSFTFSSFWAMKQICSRYEKNRTHCQNSPYVESPYKS